MYMAYALTLENITKTYGMARGVEDITLRVPTGTIYGFLGPNGAGKTTTISMLVGLLKPTGGRALLFNEDIASHGVQLRKRIGYLAGDMALDGSLTGKQQLEYFQNIRGINCQQYVTELAEKLDCDLHKKIKQLSRGNKQKIGLISALMHKPDLLILDEPTSGLDPLIQDQFNNILLEHKSQGKTTFISSHILSEVQALCDHVAFIKDGKLIADKPTTEITKDAPYIVKMVVGKTSKLPALKKLAGVKAVLHTDNTLSFLYSGEIATLVATLAPMNITDLTIEHGDLETVFMDYYKDADNA